MPQISAAPASGTRRLSSATQSERWILFRSGVHPLLWVLIALFHLFNGIVAFATGAVHLLLSQPAMYASISAAQLPVESMAMSGWSYLIISALHLLSVGSMIVLSAWQRRWVFDWRSSTAPYDPMSSPGSSGSASSYGFLVIPLMAIHAARRLLARCLRALGALGVTGRYFFVYYGLRELLEVLSQTYQAYYISRTVDQPAINRLAVAMVIINALSSPVLLLTVHKRDRVRRVLTVVIDMCLDFVCAIVIPIVLLRPVIEPYNWAEFKYPLDKIYDYVWLARSIAVVRQLFVTSTLDFFSTLLPHVGLVFGLNSIKRLLDRNSLAQQLSAKHQSQRTTGNTAVASTTSLRARHPGPASVVPTTSAIVRQPTHALGDRVRRQSELVLARLAVFKGRFEVVFMGVMLLLAGAVLGIHSLAMRRTWDPVSARHCLAPLHPWLVERAPCAVVAIDCHAEHLRGTHDEVDAVLSRMDRELVTTILLLHCPALTLPPVLAEFGHLRNLLVFNSTLVDWPVGAAITHARHPGLHSVDLLDVNMSAFPAGLMADRLPRSLLYLSLQHSNLTAFPDLGPRSTWGGHVWKELHLSFLAGAPTGLTQLRTGRLFAVNHQLEALPDELFAAWETTTSSSVAASPLSTMALEKLVLSGHGLRRLPRSLSADPRQLQTLSFFMAENTRIASLDATILTWLETAATAAAATGTTTTSPSDRNTKAIVVSFYGSPVCDGNGELVRRGLDAAYCGTYHASDQDDATYVMMTAPFRLVI